MMTRPVLLLATAVLAAAPLAAQTAKAPPPGARPGDKAMTCEAVAAERADIAAAADKRAGAHQVAVKRKHAMFGILKSVAGGMVPGAALGIGGLGGQAAYLASGQAINSVNPGGNGGAPAAVAPSQTKDETDRLARLDQIAAYRSCAK